MLKRCTFERHGNRILWNDKKTHSRQMGNGVKSGISKRILWQTQFFHVSRCVTKASIEFRQSLLIAISREQIKFDICFDCLIAKLKDHLCRILSIHNSLLSIYYKCGNWCNSIRHRFIFIYFAWNISFKLLNFFGYPIGTNNISTAYSSFQRDSN